MRLRSHLTALVLAVLVPLVVFAAIVVVMFGRQQHADAERGAVQTARALMNAVDEALAARSPRWTRWPPLAVWPGAS